LYNLHQVWIDKEYVYYVTSSGLDVISIDSLNKVSYIELEDTFTTIWGNDDTIYLGTSLSGIKYINKTAILTNESSPYDLSIYLNDYDYYYNTTSDTIKYIHGYSTTLAVVTSSGLDILNNDPYQGYKSTTSNNNITTCFMTSRLETYYNVQVSDNDGIFKINNSKCDWQYPSISYSINNSFLPSDSYINNIFVTEGTSDNGIDNTLFVATTSGVYIYDEGSESYDFYNTTTPTSLDGTSNNTVVVKADQYTNRTNGKIYVTSSGVGASLSILNLSNKSLFDSYTVLKAGRTNEVLTQEDIKDFVILH